MADRVHATVYAMQSPGLHAVMDRVLAEADGEELSVRDNAMLATRERGNYRVALRLIAYAPIKGDLGGHGA